MSAHPTRRAVLFAGDQEWSNQSPLAVGSRQSPEYRFGHLGRVEPQRINHLTVIKSGLNGYAQILGIDCDP